LTRLNEGQAARCDIQAPEGIFINIKEFYILKRLLAEADLPLSTFPCPELPDSALDVRFGPYNCAVLGTNTYAKTNDAINKLADGFFIACKNIRRPIGVRTPVLSQTQKPAIGSFLPHCECSALFIRPDIF
jgi:hypothetical protein